jgi:anti-sigma B factor antagonist
MDVLVRTVEGVTVVALAGELTWATAPEAQKQILDVVAPGGRVILDMSAVPFMSSGGLRMLLFVYRNVAARGGRAVLVGLSPELHNTMTVTGFLSFFIHAEGLDAGLQLLSG